MPFVEEGWLEGEVVFKVAHTYLDSLKSFGIDTLILGCTHYPLLTKVIQNAIGESVRLVNSAEETAKEARELLDKLGCTAGKSQGLQETRFYVSDEPEQFRILGERFLGHSIHSVAKVGDHVSEHATCTTETSAKLPVQAPATKRGGSATLSGGYPEEAPKRRRRI